MFEVGTREVVGGSVKYPVIYNGLPSYEVAYNACVFFFNKNIEEDELYIWDVGDGSNHKHTLTGKLERKTTYGVLEYV